MCGIVGYTGPREAYPVILKGLKRLEYRDGGRRDSIILSILKHEWESEVKEMLGRKLKIEN